MQMLMGLVLVGCDADANGFDGRAFVDNMDRDSTSGCRSWACSCFGDGNDSGRGT